MSMVNSVSGKKLKHIWLMCGHPKNCAKPAATMLSLFQYVIWCVVLVYKGWRMIMMCCLCAKLGLLIQKRKCMYTLENVDPMGGPVSEIGPVIKVHAMPINCSAENVVETVTEECTQNGIEDMNDDGAKGGSDDENEVVGLGVQDVETEVVETTVETEPEVCGISFAFSSWVNFMLRCGVSVML